MSSTVTGNVSAHPDAADYAKHGFGNKMGWGQRPVLLVIDVCKAYWTTGSPLDIQSHEPSAKSPESIRRLLAASRKAGIPVMWTSVEYTMPGMKDAGLFYNKAKSLEVWHTGDNRGLEGYMEGIVPQDNEYLYKKKYPSAFFGTTLATDLAALGADTIVLCGVSTSGCVRASCLDTMQYGFRPMVVAEACGDRSDAIHGANLFDMNAKYADVVNEAEAIEHISKGWPKA